MGTHPTTWESNLQRVIQQLFPKTSEMFAIRRLTTSAARKSDPIQAIFVGKVKEYSKLAAAGKLDQAEVNAEIEAAKARLGATGDMTAFPKLEFSDPDFSHAVEFKLN